MLQRRSACWAWSEWITGCTAWMSRWYEPAPAHRPPTSRPLLLCWQPITGLYKPGRLSPVAASPATPASPLPALCLFCGQNPALQLVEHLEASGMPLTVCPLSNLRLQVSPVQPLRSQAARQPRLHSRSQPVTRLLIGSPMSVHGAIVNAHSPPLHPRLHPLCPCCCRFTRAACMPSWPSLCVTPASSSQSTVTTPPTSCRPWTSRPAAAAASMPTSCTLRTWQAWTSRRLPSWRPTASVPPSCRQPSRRRMWPRWRRCWRPGVGRAISVHYCQLRLQHSRRKLFLSSLSH